jgi:hypothetical protein
VLPREIRDNTYHHLLVGSTINKMKTAMRPSPQLVGYVHIGNIFITGKHPRFTRSRRVHAQIFNEITQAFYKRCTLVLYYPQAIRSLLEYDFFGNGVRPDMCTLSSLTVRVPLYATKMTGKLPIDPAKLGEQFARLLCPGQISRQFHLHIIFIPQSSTFGTTEMEKWKWLHQEEYPPKLQDPMRVLELSLKSIKPVIDDLQRISVGGRIEASISLDPYIGTGGYLEIFNKMDWAETSALGWSDEVAKRVYEEIDLHDEL